MRSLLRYIVFLLIPTITLSQNETKRWLIGSGVGMNFITNPVTIYSSGSATLGWGYLEGNATVADANGNLLFSTNGRHIINQNLVTMDNGLNIYPVNNTSSTQSALIIKQPLSSNLYYVFSLHVQTQFNALRYSVVDMNLAAGLGSVTVKAATLSPNFYSAEKLTAVRHCNGTDVWIVTRAWDNGQFYSYLLTPTGLNSSPVISQVAADTVFDQGYMKISPNGKKIAYIGKQHGIYNYSYDAVIVHNFDASTGMVSTNSLVLGGINFFKKAYGLEFSPDASKLYISCGINGINSNALYQWDLCAGNGQMVENSRTLLDSNQIDKPGGALQLGPDGKIYFSKDMNSTISVINAPNNAGVACSYSSNLISIPSATAMMRWGLPNFMVSYFQQAHPIFEYTLHCQTAQFAAYSNTLLNSCTATNQNLQSIIWNFGDPASGAYNSSTLQNPSHVFTGLGTYTVKAIFQYQCRTDTISRVINVIHSTPSFSVTGRSSICKGESTILSANTNSLSYFWFYPLPGGTNSSSITVNPQSTTMYSVTGTFGSCSLSKAVTVTVSNCTDVSEIKNITVNVNLYPNPVNNSLQIQLESNFITDEPIELGLYDLQGRLILKELLHSIKPNVFRLELSEYALSTGLYHIKLVTESLNTIVNLPLILNSE